MTSTFKVSQSSDLGVFWKKYGAVILKYGLVPISGKGFGVGGSTFRAYGDFVRRRKKTPLAKPKEMMREWIDTEFAGLGLHTCKSYATFHANARDSLGVFWKRHKGGLKLRVFPYACKLIDLHVKHLAWHQVGMSAAQRRRLILEAFQPLDSYSLKLLGVLGVSRLDKEAIGGNASMGLVRSEREYMHFQKEIRKICASQKIPAFAFDQVAWNTQV